MKNWIRVGGRYINLDQVSEIITDVQRIDYRKSTAYEDEPCIVFVLAIHDESTTGEIRFFGDDRLRLLEWLGNDVEAEITNINFFEVRS